MNTVVPKKISEHDSNILKQASALETLLLESKAYRKAVTSYIDERKQAEVEPTLWDFSKREAYDNQDILKDLNVCDYSAVYDKYIDQLDDSALAPMLDYYTIAHAKYIFSRLVPSQAKVLGWE